MLNKIMERLNKPFEPITTLIIIYFALVAISIALYALIQIFFKSDTATATGLLGWTATIFATIALLYTFNSWRDQKGSEVLSKKCENIILDFYEYRNESITSLLFFHESLINKNAKSIDNFFNQSSLVIDIYIRIERELNITSIYKNELKLVFEELEKLNNKYLSVLDFIKQEENSLSSEDFIKYDKDIKQITVETLKYYKDLDDFKTFIEEYCIKYIFHKK